VIARSTGVSYPAINASDLARISLPTPTLAEQSAIVAFLDRETGKIDGLIAQQEKLLALLAEKRQATISHAVTKGLNPDAPMKDSGVEWLGEVPGHWEIESIRHILEAIGDVDHFMPESVEKGVPYLMTGDLKEFVSDVSLDDCKQVSHNDYLELSKRIKSSKGDVIMARYATIGTLMYVDIDVDFLVSYSCVTLKTNNSKVSGLYLFQYMKSDAFRQGVENQINTNTQGNVGIKDLQNVKIVAPPIDEQSSIVSVLTAETSKLDALTQEATRAIELLKERRTALISAAVTGKIDVRGVAFPGGELAVSCDHAA
jgi:type I restriction enzyme S subunit